MAVDELHSQAGEQSGLSRDEDVCLGERACVRYQSGLMGPASAG